MRAGILTVALSLVVAAAGQFAPAKAQPQVMALPRLQPWQGDFDGMLKRRTVRILVTASRTLFFLDKGTAKGIEAELGTAFEEWLNERYGTKNSKIHVSFVPTSRDRLLSDLIAGKGDIVAANLTNTPERLALVDFADPFASGVKEILVTGPAAKDVKTLDDLVGKPLRVRASSSYWTHLQTINSQRIAAGKPALDLQPADENLEDEDLLDMVSAGLLPWAVMDRFKAVAWSGILKGLTIREDIVINEGGDTGWAVRKNSPRLKKELAEFVAGHKVGTAFGNDLRLRYVTTAKAIKNALDQKEADKLIGALTYFRASGGDFGIDPLLLAAQGYQESTLNQALKSKSGAVGIMQIKQSTADVKEVAVPNVAGSAERNIQAAAKYLRYLADKYITDPDISPRERVLMALAAYNAGPGNLKKFRDYAAKYGFKTNVWFGNVENGAAAIIGQETVQYIGNIYKYYIAYSILNPKPVSATAEPSKP